MHYVANVASSVIFVRELDRSMSFYTEVFGCETAFSGEDGALLLSADGFQIYLIVKGDRETGISDSIGAHNLMWATESADGLKHFEDTLKKRGNYTYTHTGGEVTFVEGTDPDGGRVVIAYPSPKQRPRSVLDGRLFN